jgi:hypothetical protein
MSIDMGKKCVAELTGFGDDLPPVIETEAACDYIEALANEMSFIAKRNGIKVLAYLLDLTSAEANSVKIRLRNAKSCGTTIAGPRKIEPGGLKLSIS